MTMYRDMGMTYWLEKGETEVWTTLVSLVDRSPGRR